MNENADKINHMTEKVFISHTTEDQNRIEKNDWTRFVGDKLNEFNIF